MQTKPDKEARDASAWFQSSVALAAGRLSASLPCPWGRAGGGVSSQRARVWEGRKPSSTVLCSGQASLADTSALATTSYQHFKET